MTPLGSSILPLILIALGLIAVILSFLVPDRKKSFISVVLAGLIIGAGFFQLFSQAFTRYQWNRRLKEIQRDRQTDLDEMRLKLKERATDLKLPPVPAKTK